MTPEEFQAASRELHTLLNEPANISSAAEFAEVLDELPSDSPICENPCPSVAKIQEPQS